MKVHSYPAPIANKREPFLACFAGIDGAGKTTQAQKLVSWLREYGIEGKYVWNKYEPWLLYPLMRVGRAFFLRGQDMFKDYVSYHKTKKRVFKKSGMSALFQLLYLGEYPLHIFFKVKLPLLFGRNVICDRYVYDMVAGLAADFDYSDKKTNKILRAFLFLLPKPDLVFLIDLPETVAYQRKDDIPSIDFLKQKRRIYLKMAQSWQMNVLDNPGTQVEVEKVIQDKAITLLARGTSK